MSDRIITAAVVLAIVGLIGLVAYAVITDDSPPCLHYETATSSAVSCAGTTCTPIMVVTTICTQRATRDGGAP